jgi:hypothetical protein
MGGAAGHMAHPFDLPTVRNGKDLIKFFDEASEYLSENESSVKIDGVNVSFKLVDGPNGKEFAMDRGSLNPLDIEGITQAKLGARFGYRTKVTDTLENIAKALSEKTARVGSAPITVKELLDLNPELSSGKIVPAGQLIKVPDSIEHGMIKSGNKMLPLLNNALPSIQSELKQLGMYDDPTMFLNTEYVAGKTNVTDYDQKFLAIHGLSQFYEKISRIKSKAQRPGAARPAGVKAPSTEVAYDKAVMKRLIDKLGDAAKKLGFEVYGDVPASLKGDAQTADFSGTLSSPFEVVRSEGEAKTKPLSQWLQAANHPGVEKITLGSGKKVNALSKEVYMSIIDGMPVDELVPDPAQQQTAIDAAVIYHATRMLGNDVLDVLTSPMGDVRAHEGVVLRDKRFGSRPVKITGDFIVGGLESVFQKNESLLRTYVKAVLKS